MYKANVVITGTSSGIGSHLARKFLDEGYDVTAVNRSPADIDHERYHELIADLSDKSQLGAVCNKLRLLSIVGLINNAGIHGPIGAFEDISLDAWMSAFDINLFGAAALTQACIPALRDAKGFIIFLSGGGSAFPRINYSAYSVSKCAIVRMSEVLAQELSPEVMVYCIAPGPNKTKLLEEAIEYGEVVPDDEIVDFDYPERLCLFLAANRDERYSGKFIHVRDNYTEWKDNELSGDGYTLRRLDPRTLSKLSLTWPRRGLS